MSWREFCQRITKMTNRQPIGNVYISISQLAGMYRMSEGQGRELGRMMKGIKKMMVEMIKVNKEEENSL